ncbi:MAG: hypothetical protein M3235_16150, partial [Actinomycetota bacterium]|nr:hypothetical protein [Actinomycetota bacterium]
GECFDSAPIPTDGSTVGISSVRKIPCADPHTQQAVATLAYPNRRWAGDVQPEATEQCASLFEDRLRPGVSSDGRHQPAIMHADLRPTGQDSTYVVCVVATQAPATGSVMK